MPTLYGARAETIASTSRASRTTQTLTVQFGDGSDRRASRPDARTSSRRTGRGSASRGASARAKLTTLLDRPTGVKSVVNLDGGRWRRRPGDDGAGPRRRARHRPDVRPRRLAARLRGHGAASPARSPRPARPGSGPASGARSTSPSPRQGGGDVLGADGLERLAATLATERDPNHQLLIDNYAGRGRARRRVDPRRRPLRERARAGGRPRGAARRACRSTSGRFAEPVYLSDVFRILQDVEGVVAVDVNILDLKSTDAGFRAAHGIDPALGQPQPRLLMLPARPLGTPGTVLPAELAWVEVPAQDVTLRASGGLVAMTTIGRNPNRLYELLPALYRIADAERGGRAARAAPARSRGRPTRCDDDTQQLWDDFFIETCQRWVIPYIGDLVGNIPLHDLDLDVGRGDGAGALHRPRRARTSSRRARSGRAPTSRRPSTTAAARARRRCSRSWRAT